MPIVGLTHKSDGTAMLRRSVTTKLAIGLPPNGNSDHPQRLDHFVFQKKGQSSSGANAEVAWEIDEEKTRHYGKNCREVSIILLDNSPDIVFRTEYAWWTKTQKQCWGDGETATRRTDQNPRGEDWEPCANDDCPDLTAERCRPSGDLYFLLADFPTLGTICKLHTSSYQSIREIYAALEDIRNATGGRLMGLRVKMFVRPEKNAYTDKKGSRMSGTKHVVGLELATNDIKQLVGQTIEASDAFQSVKQQLDVHSVQIEDPEAEQVAAITAEFYPASDIKPASEDTENAVNRSEDPDQKALREITGRIESAFTDLKLTTARRQALLDQHRKDLPGLMERLARELERRNTSQPGPNEAARTGGSPHPGQNGGSGNLGNGTPARPENSRRNR